MSKPWQTGILVVSIDLEGDVQQRTQAAGGSDDTFRRLVGLFSKYSVVATWAVADPLHSAATSFVQKSDADHELAVMGDPTWAGNTAGRARFGKELRRRVEGARHCAIPISALVLNDVKIDGQYDLLQKCRITALRGQLADRSRPKTNSPKPQLLRFGLWHLPVSCSLPSTRRWLPGAGSFAACRAIRRSAQTNGFAHLTIDATQLADSGGMHAVEQVLRFADTARKQQQLAIETMGRLAQRLSAIRQIQPSRSILRPAA